MTAKPQLRKRFNIFEKKMTHSNSRGFRKLTLCGENLNILLIPFAAFTPKVEKNDEKGG